MKDSFQEILLIKEIMLYYNTITSLPKRHVWPFCSNTGVSIKTHFACERFIKFLLSFNIKQIKHYSSRTISFKRLEVMRIIQFHANKTWITRKLIKISHMQSVLFYRHPPYIWHAAYKMHHFVRKKILKIKWNSCVGWISWCWYCVYYSCSEWYNVEKLEVL